MFMCMLGMDAAFAGLLDAMSYLLVGARPRTTSDCVRLPLFPGHRRHIGEQSLEQAAAMGMAMTMARATAPLAQRGRQIARAVCCWC